MSRTFRKLPSLSNVAGGSTATLQVPLGFTYDVIKLRHTGLTAAQMKNIEVRINAKVVQKFKDGDRLNALNKYYNRQIEANVLTFWFLRPEMENNALRRMTSIGTADISTFDIRFDIDAAATSPVVEAYAVRSVNQPLGMITKIKDFPASSATSGVKEIDNIPKEGRIAAIHNFKADISKCEVTLNSVIFSEFDKALNSGLQADNGRVPDDTKHTTVDFTLEGDPAQALIVEGVNDFRIRNTLDTPGAFDLVVEYLTGYAGI